MSSAALPAWHAANQRYLVAALDRVREALERYARRQATGDGATHEQPPSFDSPIEWDLPVQPAVESLTAIFGLSAFERDVLLLCAGVELDGAFAACCAAAQGDPRQVRPTFSLALAALPGAHWSALSPAAPLRRWRLIEVGAGEALTSSPLRIDERILHCLAGVSYLDERLHGLLERVAPIDELPASHQSLAQSVADVWSHPSTSHTWPALQLCGHDGSSQRAIVAAACAALDVQLYALRAADIPSTAAERDQLARLWVREAALSRSALLIDCHDLDEPDAIHTLLAFLENVPGLVAIAGPRPLRTRQRVLVRLDVRQPPAAEQQALWARAIGPAAASLNGYLEPVAAQFSLGPHGIRMAMAQVQEQLAQVDGQTAARLLWDACREQARPHLDGLAARIEPTATWDDLVLPELQRQILREIAAAVRQRFTVYERWGFAARSARGLGITALFAGPSGTGKTMAAEVLANELRLDLYHVDLSAVISKYIGETEKNLRRIFDAADEGGAILLFDEADALFGKRSEVKDSHDRYANIEVSYLLQRMEAYRGLAILTTNMKDALDTAFLRRIRFVVQFPFPDAAQRAEIWRRVFPPGVPTQGLSAEKLGRLSVAGGNIRNIALQAAFLAADAGEPVQMSHVLRAARSEYAKLERALTESEVGGWT